jgi:hypothetical protein
VEVFQEAREAEALAHLKVLGVLEDTWAVEYPVEMARLVALVLLLSAQAEVAELRLVLQSSS